MGVTDTCLGEAYYAADDAYGRVGRKDHEILDFECAELARGFERFVFHVLLITQQVSLLDRETYFARPKLCQDRICRVEPDSPVFEDRHFPPSSQQPFLERLRRLCLIQQALRSLDYLRGFR